MKIIYELQLQSFNSNFFAKHFLNLVLCIQVNQIRSKNLFDLQGLFNTNKSAIHPYHGAVIDRKRVNTRLAVLSKFNSY